MALGTFAVGHYDATYGGTDIGLVEGSKVIQRNSKGLIIQSSKWGESAIDAIYSGGDTHVILTLKEWTSTVEDCMWPWGSDTGEMGTVGRLHSDVAKAMVWTVESGTPAATNGQSTITFHSCILDADASYNIAFGVEARDVTVAMRCLPIFTGGVYRWYTET